MKEITYVTRIRINGEYRELSQEEAKKLLQERIENTLQGLNYKKAAGYLLQPFHITYISIFTSYNL